MIIERIPFKAAFSSNVALHSRIALENCFVHTADTDENMVYLKSHICNKSERRSYNCFRLSAAMLDFRQHRTKFFKPNRLRTTFILLLIINNNKNNKNNNDAGRLAVVLLWKQSIALRGK